MRHALLLFIISIFTQPIFAEPEGHEAKSGNGIIQIETGSTKKDRDVDYSDAPYILIDLKEGTKKEIRNKSELKANRLYLRREERLGGYVFDLTDVNKSFGENSHFLKVGSTIPGQFAGGEEKDWFIFEGESHDVENWKWMPNPGKPGYYYLQYLNRKIKTDRVTHSIPPGFQP